MQEGDRNGKSGQTDENIRHAGAFQVEQECSHSLEVGRVVVMILYRAPRILSGEWCHRQRDTGPSSDREDDC